MRALTFPAMLAASACCGFLAGCAKTIDPPPTISLGARACPGLLDTSQAKPIAVGGKEVAVNIDPGFPCIAGLNNAVSLYTAFRLPKSMREYFVSVVSQPKGGSLLSPRAILLDGKGATLREIPRDSFVFHGSSLYAGIRVHANEEYLIVASDPSSVGQDVSQTIDSTQSNVYAAGPVIFTVNSGLASTKTMTYSHTGTLTVSAEVVPGS